VVVDAASLGALRAAELHAFGMEGVGAIFAAFRDGQLRDDDEVAVQHGPPELGYRTLSEALVNIRATLEAAEGAGVIAKALRAELEATAKAMLYPERSWDALLAAAHARELPAEPLAALRGWLPANEVDQKRKDALALLRTLSERAARSLPARPPTFHFESTELWHRFVQEQERLR
jgi:hypothetical protein